MLQVLMCRNERQAAASASQLSMAVSYCMQPLLVLRNMEALPIRRSSDDALPLEE